MGSAPTVPTQVMQGIEVPASSINPAEFFAKTRRLVILEKNITSFAGLGSTDVIPILQTGVLAGISVRFKGTVTVTVNTGTVATSGRWPYDLLSARFTANGQSNLINVHGGKLKAREIMARGWLTDRGVVRGIGGASPGTQVQQGTMSLNTENWGVGSNVTAIASGTYDVELEWFLPVAWDQMTLTGAIFAQTSATDLFCALDYAKETDLFTLTNDATVAVAGGVVAEAVLYSIPQGANGDIIIPDLSVFHSLIESSVQNAANGDNEIRLAGQGVGKKLLRIFGQTWNNGQTTPVPLGMNATNYGNILWRFGGNDTPETWYDGGVHSHRIEKLFDSDLATYQGYWCHDWAKENAFRDAIDEATATELRYLVNIQNGVTLTNAFTEYVQETVSIGAAA